MMDFIFWILSAFGLAYVLGHSLITAGLRGFIFRKGRLPGRWFVWLLECPACVGFWTAIILAWVRHQREPGILIQSGLVLVATNYIFSRLTKLIPAPKEEA